MTHTTDSFEGSELERLITYAADTGDYVHVVDTLQKAHQEAIAAELEALLEVEFDGGESLYCCC